MKAKTKLTLVNKYNEKYFVKNFSLYTQSQNINAKKYKKYIRDFKDAFDIRTKIGFTLINQSIGTEIRTIYNIDNNFNSINLGIDFEHFFNTIDKKNSIIFNYQYNPKTIREKGFDFSNFDDTNVTSNISMNNLSFKYRRYFSLKKDNNLFADIGLNALNLNSNTTYIYKQQNLILADITSNQSFNYGVSFVFGYDYKKFLLEINYMPKVKIKGESPTSIALIATDWIYNTGFLNFHLGYTIY